MTPNLFPSENSAFKRQVKWKFHLPGTVSKEVSIFLPYCGGGSVLPEPAPNLSLPENISSIIKFQAGLFPKLQPWVHDLVSSRGGVFVKCVSLTAPVHICHFPKNCPLYPHHVLFGLCEAHSSHEHMVFKPGLGSVLFCLLNHVFGRYQSLLHHSRRLLSFNSYPLKATSGSFPALTPYLSFYCLPVFNLSSVCLPRRGIWYTMRLLALELNIIIGTEHLSYGMFIIEFHMKI